MTSLRTRERLVQRLLAAGLEDDLVIAVLRQLPRHLFVEEALASHAYEDSALPIGWGQTISQPYMVARMTQALLAAGPVQTVLEVGTGSGYQTAVLAALVRRVYSIERISSLQARAEQRLRALKLRNVRLRHADGSTGWAEYAPFDGILVTAAASGIPRRLAEQLAPGGRMVLPIDCGRGQVLVRLLKKRRGQRSGYQHEVLEPVSFVPLLGGLA
ncbi:MAG: protein-L-isoaspartate(D-aspartate) O-methyltransferase [Lamprobacter sp.]|uniref:protein-L-isoaspartate(D-aspartate) O-methyltransferase n=1 Tax=Lamprobacter sp. TaxID=3100796 RepID=UPI002B25EA9A|nr:protein-L-isoaspartate(D-aspartate) O-methyltransferase [Lamprobacter sp.]MEA3640308.1 protein-L-isoaspartate(D-aspartate) O-methyltransferase [Lamprobacter sp.]